MICLVAILPISISFAYFISDLNEIALHVGFGVYVLTVILLSISLYLFRKEVKERYHRHADKLRSLSSTIRFLETRKNVVLLEKGRRLSRYAIGMVISILLYFGFTICTSALFMFISR